MVSFANHPRSSMVRLLALFLAVLLQAQNCPGGAATYVVQRFDLPRCPEQSLALPDLARDGPYEISAVRHPVEWCPGFKGYEFRENGSERFQPVVRLGRGQTCTVDIAYAYIPSEERRTHLKENGARWAALVAQLVMSPSDIPPGVPASQIDSFGTYARFQGWCARTGDHARRPCVEMRPFATLDRATAALTGP